MKNGNNTDLSEIITFRLCDQVFGLPVSSVREVVPVAWLDRPPRMPSLVQGVLNLSGQAVPVLRLDRLLGLGDGRYGMDSSILIMREAERPLGLLVEHVDGVRAADQFTVMGLSDTSSFNDCLSDQLERDGQVLHLLSWRNILLVEERRRLADFQAMAQTRLAEMGVAQP